MRSFVYCTACVLISAVFAFAAAPDYGALLDHLDTRCAENIETISTVGEVHQNKLIFKTSREQPVHGQELLVLKAVDGMPPALYETKAVIRVTAAHGSSIAARVVHTMTGPPQSGDPIARPANPKIFLSRDTSGGQEATAYQHLLQTLLSANYHVIEAAGPERIEQTEGYGLQVHLSESGDQAAVKIRSIYTPATLFSETYASSDVYGPDAHEADAPGGQAGTAAGSSPAIASPSRPAIKPEAAPPKDRGAAASKVKKIRLDEKFNRITTAELDGRPPEELLLLNNKGVFAYQLENGSLTRLDTYLFESSSRIGLHLHAMDVDGSGRETVFATCAQKTTYLDADDSAIRSLALDWKDGQWTVRAAEIPFYLRVLQTPASGEVLLGQTKEGPEAYSGPVFRVKWDEKKETFARGPVYEPARGVHCLYQFVPAGPSEKKDMILEPNHHVSLYQMPEERLLDMTDVQFGPYREAAFPVRLAEKAYRGGFDEEISSKQTYAVRKLLFKPELQDQCFFIQKGRRSQGLGKRMMDLVSRETGRDRVVALKADGSTLYESWKSAALPRDLIDFTFFRQDKQTGLLALVRDSRGYILEFLSEAQ
ncbi:MAG: hypothetical protein ACOCTS_02110 [Thermodesulfobacteriota bacterium]